jgi:hypothetical protein
MLRLAQSWQNWLFRSGPLWPLALCRIIWALAMLLATLHESGLAQLYSHAQYHVALLPFAQPLDPNLHRYVIGLAALGGVLALLGAFARLGILLVVCALGYLFAIDLLLFRNHVYLGVLIGGLLACSPCSNVWSVDAMIRRRVGGTTGSLACAQLIKAQVLIVYGYSVVNKLRRPFLDGFVLERELPLALRSSPLRALLFDAHGAVSPTVASFLHSPSALAASSIAVVCAEAFLVIGLPMRALRPYAVAVGLALHTTIFLSMGIHVFGLLMLSSYVLFFAKGAPPEA